MQMISVSSSAVIALGFEGDRIRVTYISGRTYEFFGNAEIFDLILKSRSIGRAVQLLGQGIEVSGD